MEKFLQLFNNYVLNCAIIAWASAQVIKTLLYLIINKKFSSERLVGAGGMPSSHSAAVCSLTIALSRTVGVASPMFAIAFILSVIVMYDAMGVRRAAGEHAKAINKMIEQNEVGTDDDSKSNQQLKEFLGHTPLEVLGGAILGILIALIVPIS
ncbi:MAG: divergent PAP2 family protein [Oscillospiraceae bacterium]